MSLTQQHIITNNTISSCSFCNRHVNEVRKIIRGSGVGICNSCIKSCNVLLDEQDKIDCAKKFHNMSKPKVLKKYIDNYVIGQEQVKKTLAVTAYNHYKRISRITDEVEISKSNILLIGPTGSGKTLLLKVLAKKLDVPFITVDATTLTESGYVGEEVNSIILKLIRAAKYDIKEAERGVIFIDEFDKLASRGEYGHFLNRDVSGKGVQQSLLQLLDGTKINVSDSINSFIINTKNILFICGGAFVGLKEIAQKRLDGVKIGFTGSVSPAICDISSEDLTEYGIIPELIGRLPVTAFLNALSASELRRVLTEPMDSIIKQYQIMLECDGIDLRFDDAALDLIVEEALDLGTGARGLRTVTERIMRDIIYNLPAPGKCFITEKTVRGGRPVLHESRNKAIINGINYKAGA